MPAKPRVQPEPTPRPNGPESGALYRLGALCLVLLAIMVSVRLWSVPPIDRLPAAPPAIAPIDINAATEAELSALPRIGPALARRIVEDRAVSGRFASIDDLDRVPGIGPRTVEAIRPHAVAR